MCPLGFNFNGADPSLKLPGITGYDDDDEDHNHDHNIYGNDNDDGSGQVFSMMA